MNQLEPASKKTAPQRVGEVVESSSDRFTAQCYRLYQAPPLGALVRTGTGDSAGEKGTESIYAVVYGVNTQSLDPGRPVIARGEDEDTEEDIYRSNPQLGRLLCTRFEALIVGQNNGNAISHRLPSSPPRIHAFVHACDPGEVGKFTNSLDFLHFLVSPTPMGQAVTDEVIVSCLRQARDQQEDPRGFLVSAGKALALQLIGDPPRLNAILKRLGS